MAFNLSHGLCAVCKANTTKHCSGCRDAPAYKSSEANGASQTFYCSSACQMSHWKAHKTECLNLQARKKLLRAAGILRRMVLAIRRHATRVRFDHLSVETTEAGGVTKVLLEEPTGLPREAEWTLVPFPNIPKDLDEDIQEGIMMRGACTEAHSYLEDWVKLLLLGLCFKIEEVNIKLHGESKLQISVKDKTGKAGRPLKFHFVYRVVLPVSGEVWAIDLTGTQFGYRDVMYSWGELDQRGWAIVHAYPAGQNVYAIAQMSAIEKREFRDAFNKNIPALAKKYGGEKGYLRDMLKGSDTEFEEARDRFLDEVEDIIKAYMVKFSSPRETRKRNKKMNALLPNPNDPKHKKQLERMMNEIIGKNKK